MHPKKQKRVYFLLALMSVGVVVVLYYLQNPVLERFEAHTYDLRFKSLRGPIAPHPGIGIIAINDKSIAELGRFPWSRRHYVDLLDQVKAAGARAVLMDAFFPEVENDATDHAFAAALKRAGNVVLAVAFDFNPDGSISNKTGSIPLITEAALGEGHINFHPDEDGVNRRSMVTISDRGKLYPSLALRGAMAALGTETIERRPFSVLVGGREIPTDYFETMLINYTGPPGTYPIYSFADVAKGRVPPEELRDKVLFMGMTALGIYDMRVTPFHGNTPGVEINATIADNIVSGRFIRRSGIEALIDLLFIVLLGFTIIFITARLSPKLTFPVFMLISVSYLWFAHFMFGQGRWISMIYPLTSALFAYVVSTAFHFMSLDRRAREIRTVFSSYVSHRVVDQLVQDPSSAKIGGVSREVTILFLDVKGFTSFSETLDPGEVVKRLNEYLALLTRVIMEHGGTVDKFLGDGIMAYWGAPLAQKDHAEAAVRCTMALTEASNRMAERHRKDGETPLTFRVGLNSGEAIAGNIGLKGKKMEYTLIGDNVNLTSRVEGAGKYYGVDALVSESTYRATAAGFLFRELDCIRVVGRKNVVRIYELLATAGKAPAETERLAEEFGRALAAYRGRRWDEAGELFAALGRDFPGDRPSALYLERCREFAKNPPPPDWDGVFKLKGK